MGQGKKSGNVMRNIFYGVLTLAVLCTSAAYLKDADIFPKHVDAIKAKFCAMQSLTLINALSEAYDKYYVKEYINEDKKEVTSGDLLMEKIADRKIIDLRKRAYDANVTPKEQFMSDFFKDSQTITDGEIIGRYGDRLFRVYKQQEAAQALPVTVNIRGLADRDLSQGETYYQACLDRVL